MIFLNKIDLVLVEIFGVFKLVINKLNLGVKIIEFIFSKVNLNEIFNIGFFDFEEVE